ncbi:MAG: RidA family protein [Candidatus Dormibacteria bacterium]
MKEAIISDRVLEQCGRPLGPYSHGISAKGGRLIFVAGQIALGRDGKILHPGDAPEQFRRCMENIATILAATGATMADVVKVVNYVTKDVDLEVAYPQIAAIRREFITSEPYPVSSLVVVHSLMQQALVEVEAVAVVSD